MAAYLGDEWLALRAEVEADLPRLDGASARLQHVVAGVPGVAGKGEVKYALVVADGVVVEAVPGVDAEADATLTTTYPDAVAILRGELDPNAAFMQGRVKVVGDMARLLPLLPLERTPERVAARAALAERTDLPA